jgi:phosphoglucosamine mutase
LLLTVPMAEATEIIEHFETDGVRGKYGEGMVTEAGAYTIGRSAGARLEAGEDPRTFVGHDPRYSSEPLAAALAEGLADAGRDVIMLGVMPTPAIAYLSAQEGVPAADITASHNPAEDNGFKLFLRGEKISDEAQKAINLDLNGPVDNIPRGRRGTITDGSAYAQRYVDFVVDSVPGPIFEGMRVAYDTANGAASRFAGPVLEGLGAIVVPMFDQPDGHNINQDCGAMHTQALRRAVVEGKLRLGFAFDGDADRSFIIGPDGTEYDGDDILFALGTEWGEKEVVSTAMANKGLEIALNGLGITLHRTEKIGDRYVNQMLVERGLTVGTEPSGHIILRNHSTTGDGLLAVTQVGRAMQTSGSTLAGWSEQWARFPQVNITMPVSKALAEHPAILAKVAAIEEQLGDSGRVLLRPSGTQKLVRVMVEANGDPAVAERHARTLANHLGELAAA